jgi:Dolichyl-phosphate-mannose-protein mannosyltransferase
LTGGFHSFGSAVDAGRVLIFLMQIVATFMVYRIARSISNNVLVATIASLLFALSPYGLYFYRRVLLDNISMFWMLLSILLLVSGKLSLKRVWLSAVALGISALSKELTFFLIPAMAYLVFARADRSHRLLATLGWMVLVISFLSLYPLMATLKNELFPTGTLLGGTAPHVSLLGTLQYQASRGKDAGLLALNSNFWVQTRVWIQGDPVLIVVGSFCAMLSVTLMRWQKMVGIIGLLTLSLWAFFARGGIVFNFYIVPLLPLLALSTSLLLWSIAKVVRMLFQKIVSHRKRIGLFIEQFVIVTCICLIVISCYKVTLETGKHYADPALAYQSDPYVFWDNNQSDAQNQAVSWIKSNIPLKSYMVVDESSWQDLYDDGYRYAHYYWKVENDPAIRNNVFHNNWRSVDYIVTTPQMLSDLVALPLVTTIWKHSTPIISFDTGGWTVEVRKVNK